MFDMNMMAKIKERVVYKNIDSPVGTITLIASDKALKALLWKTQRKLCEKAFESLELVSEHPIINKTERQLEEYFCGKRIKFDIPLSADGTEFQKQAWEILKNIPYGEVITYGEQAKKMGDIKKARAVGLANSMNPISIIVPCHRVIGKNGKLTGFAGGLDIKSFLLDLEKNIG
ncbi:methylated-DNA--[protein]-cysteine S-methyltransferase [Clostridium ganghwense]|uniref:Methylated-DNA--protein-cysteine methyltransferase n=1 Tax=Clostridium ganghwense TaxID=312089 RepID=A0ABT4CM74_9CLOT|nr:methylated-DNA--[protein]-cysteine S-methyltransferase [Clostridium ganghwense]MCY6369196.1 methylated-DNA--[protein]-cysteine S-methyltransferase [Clostridium ganghwense]